MMKYDMNGDGVVDAGDMAASMVQADKELEEAEGSLELLEARERAKGEGDDDDDDDGDGKDDDDDEFSLEIVDTQTKFEQDKKKAVGESSGGGSVYILKSFNFASGTTVSHGPCSTRGPCFNLLGLITSALCV